MSLERWPHQQAAYEFALKKPASMLAMWMGTGKTRVALDLLNEWNAHRTLILCPLSVMPVWRREIAKWGRGRYEVEILDKGTVRTQTRQAEFACRTAEPIIIVQNYDSARVATFSDWSLDQRWSVVVLDESHRIKAHNSKISRYAGKLAAHAQRRLCLTGTPMPHSPLDVFGQYRFLDWRIFGKYWSPFLQSFAERRNPMIPQMITSYRNLDVLKERFARLAFQAGREVLDLIPVTHHRRTFSLPPAALRVYDDLERDFITWLGGDEVVTAANTLVKTLRLRQVVSGFLQPDDRDHYVEMHRAKYDALVDLLQDLCEPAVVFGEFLQDLAAIQRAAEQLGLRYGEVSGRHKDLTSHGTMPEDIDVLGVQYQAGGLGIDLTRARICVLYSPTYSLGNYDQALARLDRPGQKRSVQYYHLIAEKTIDEIVYRSLRDKRQVVESIMSALKPEKK